MAERRKLTDILRAGKSTWLEQTDWSKGERAVDFGKPVPTGLYAARIISGELSEARTGTPSFKLTFEISEEGPHKGRKVWHDIWLTDAAKKQALRDFDKLGIKNLKQLEGGLPAILKAKIRVIVHQNDKGIEYNVIRSFEVIGIEPVEPDPFAPPPDKADDLTQQPPPDTADDPTPQPQAGGGLFGDDDLGAYAEKH